MRLSHGGKCYDSDINAWFGKQVPTGYPGDGNSRLFGNVTM
jgi:hypothetical protein